MWWKGQDLVASSHIASRGVTMLSVSVISSSRPLSFLLTFFLLLHSEWLSGQLWVISCIYRPLLPVECNYTEVYGRAGVNVFYRHGPVCVCMCGALSVIWPQTVNSEWQSLFNPNLQCSPWGLAFGVGLLATIISNYTTHRQLLSIGNLAVAFFVSVVGPNKISCNI